MANSSLRMLANAMNRRTLLGRGAALMGGLFAGMQLPSGTYGQMKSPVGDPRDSNVWNIVVGGECQVEHPFSMQTDPEFLAVLKLLRESDVTFAHMENTLGDDDELEWAIGGSLHGPSKIAQELKWAGIDLMSIAFNHSYAWGPQGVLSTMKACDKAGIVHAGHGRELEEARGPKFLDLDKGRVALIAISTGNNAYEMASLGKGIVPGRPGVNPLRTTMKYEVDHNTAVALREIGKKLGVLSTNPDAKEFNMGYRYVDGNKFEVAAVPDQEDIEGNLRSVDDARQFASFVIVAHHVSISEGGTGAAGRGNTPVKFVPAFAKKAIDTGADMYIGHGWHRTLGIEIYKNKPIIYGTGNFFWEGSFTRREGSDGYEGPGNMDKLTILNPSSFRIHPDDSYDYNDLWWNSALLQLRFENKKLTEIRLHPVELGWDISGGEEKSLRTRPAIGSGPNAKTEGIPWLATGANAQKILERIQKLSAENYGTKIEIQNGVGIARIPS